MKWLLLLLVSINVILFVVQIKEMDGVAVVSGFKKAKGAQELTLLKDVSVARQARCVVVGALPDENTLNVLDSFLNKNQIGYELIEKEHELAPSYWVYVVDDVEDSLIDRLNAVGVETYLIASGALSGRLSAGLFENIDLARGMVGLLKGEGVNADFVEKKKVKKTKWISFRLEEIENGTRIINALEVMDLNLGEIKEFFCKSIASEKEFP